jgi:hypothetical protein
MTNESQSPYTLTTRPCEIDVGQFRWDIHRNDSLFQSSAESFVTQDDAYANGMVELERLIGTIGTDDLPSQN